jgi:signal transduction histidine kinase
MSVFLALSLRSSLDDAMNDTLATRQREVGALVGRGGTLARPTEPDEGIAQLLRRDGSVTATTFVRRPLLTADELRDALARPVQVERRSVPELGTSLRLLAGPVNAPMGTVVLVVGGSLGDRDDALNDFLRRLLVAAPLVLLLVSAGGYLVAAAALRPVERMRAEADAITGVELGRRLTVPPADDEIARLGRTLNVMLGRLDEAVERERRFVADASHELRTPLAALSVELDLALRRPREPGELAAALRSAAEECGRLTQLAESLLVLARVDAGQALQREEVPAAALLGRAAARVAGGVMITCPDDLALQVDAGLAELAVANLVTNAVTHGRAPVRIVATRHGAMAEIHVHDAGGVDPAFAGRAFERFARADAARGRGGFGLGLALVAAVARAHGGEARLDTGEAGGSDAWITLPAASPSR